MFLELTTDGAAAWDLAQLKRHERITTTDDDTLLGELAAAAQVWMEEYLGRALTNKTYTLYLDGWSTFARGPLDDFWYTGIPMGRRRKPNIILPRLPVVEVDSVKYRDTGGTLQTLAASEYQVHLGTGELAPSAAAAVWPTASADYLKPIEIQFEAGYGTASTTVPARLRTGLFMLVGHLYENREHTVPMALEEVPAGLYQLINDYKHWSF